MNTELILTHGLIYTCGFVLIILISVLINPRIWLQDFPGHLTDNIPPKNNREVKQTFITGFIFAVFIVSFPLYSLSVYIGNYDSLNIDYSFFLHTFSVMMICNFLYWMIFHRLIFNLLIGRLRTVPGLSKKIKLTGWKRQILGMFVGILMCAGISWFVVFTAGLFI